MLPFGSSPAVQEEATSRIGVNLGTIAPIAAERIAKNNASANRIAPEDKTVHDWYRFVLSFPPHLVREYIRRFGLNSNSLLLDPFCGTGTTLVESKRLGIPSVGVEAHPMSHFASTTKVDWSVDPEQLRKNAARITAESIKQYRSQNLSDEPAPGNHHATALRSLNPESFKLLLTDSISPLPLHKAILLCETIDKCSTLPYRSFLRLALAKALVTSISNLHFGPEVGVTKPKPDAAVVLPWLAYIDVMAADLAKTKPYAEVSARVYNADSRQELSSLLPPNSVDAVITSPPYPNEKDYTRTTRLESVLLGFIKTKDDLRRVKKELVRSNTRSVYKQDDDHHWVSEHPEVDKISTAIEKRRIELGKTSGFERMYARLTKLYFGGMARHLGELRKVLRPGAFLAYVVGDQASYLRVMIRTGQLLAQIAESLGYEVINIDLFRTRLATATREQLREEVVVLKWPGRRT
jgi:hypothetical protein